MKTLPALHNVLNPVKQTPAVLATTLLMQPKSLEAPIPKRVARLCQQMSDYLKAVSRAYRKHRNAGKGFKGLSEQQNGDILQGIGKNGSDCLKVRVGDLGLVDA